MIQTRVHTRLSLSVAYCRFVAQESLRISWFSCRLFEICTRSWQLLLYFGRLQHDAISLNLDGAPTACIHRPVNPEVI
ncbi:hypothetical protein PILCRDRAFT_371857 [Piloderma croceum F 1598]|uniref:Uncharacterized protein n=1 Tax=Piloderma croceum (strain F 1598) TaxID=765440 RepID=A0A0C3FYX8_PILCF|nr:hypothetical protein PILCRDRAFT_371857 [Piloderma croceum F 1598]